MMMTGINDLICHAKPYGFTLSWQYVMLLLSLGLQYCNLGNISKILIFLLRPFDNLKF